MKNIVIDHPAEHVARILINRPDAKNALDHLTRQELLDALRQVVDDKNNRAIIFAGVNHILSAGGDVPSMAKLTEKQARDRMRHGRELCRAMAECPLPVVSVIEGMGVGNSVGLAMLSDFILMDEKAFILFPFLKLGLIPDWAILHSLPLRVGSGRAKQILMTCERVPAQKALAIGLADEVVAKENAMDTAIEKAVEFSKLPIAAFARMKHRLNQIATTIDEELRTEEDNQSACLNHDEFREGFKAFIEKRSADFRKL